MNSEESHSKTEISPTVEMTADLKGFFVKKQKF
ncbi:hypothetical protein M2347_004170 [Chryseobacterium sp. H1D6B]|nr:hypothetical protein [Chryseobacterium sp. H1D6B]